MNEGLRTNNLVSNFGNYKNKDLLEVIKSLLQIYKERQQQWYSLPVTLFFLLKLGILEKTIKYIKQNYSLNYHNISILLNRDDRIVWVAYSNAIKKHKVKLLPKESRQHIPVAIFTNRKLGLLEALTVFLRNKLHLSFNEIPVLLKKYYGTV
ncbi:MAG: hypothetical protein QXG00_03625 [Candidatus Woesearchaeota archaeon]